MDFNINLDDQQSAKQIYKSDEQSAAEAAGESNKQKPLGKSVSSAAVDQLPDYSQKKIMNADDQVSYLSQAAHPNMCILTFLFKLISIVTYILVFFVLSSFTLSKTFPFVITILSAAIDFWIVKNLTGRYVSRRGFYILLN